MITLGPMLMYDKEAGNRKQKTERQRHTIPNQRPKDKLQISVINYIYFYFAIIISILNAYFTL